MIEKVCVYCASSSQSHHTYLDAAYKLGEILASHSITIQYGGGGVGSMGSLANGSLARGGRVIGYIPQFMKDLEWAHPAITELKIVADMHERKHRMLHGVDAVIALPGGSGTFDELFETISLKRLGIYLNPIILVNIRDYFNPCLQVLNKCISERFMNPEHKDMWQVVDAPEDVIPAIETSPRWHPDAINFAAV
ncbi:TIGR00730 family Rossman fold protein [candidate division KSB1 bacterium]|nr:TIGR00730 family Rossman fold protein [candidate division KSB1 bacterium]